MGDALETWAYAAGKNFAASDRAIIPVPCAIETCPDDARVPCAPLGEHGSDVRSMMLRRAFVRCGKLRGMQRRDILRMRVVNDQQFVRINFIHRKQITNGIPECTKRFVMIEVS